MTRLSGITAVATAGMLLALFSSTAEATATLQLTSGTTVTITDQEADGGGDDDVNGALGAVTWIGSIGVFTVNVTTGATYPSLGTAALPQMDVNSLDISSAAGTLTILFSQTDFTGIGGGALNIGGTQTTCGAGCTITYQAWWNPNNTLFATQNQIDGTLSSSLAAFALAGSGAGPTAAPYSLTQRITITRGAAGSTSFDAHLAVPEPASMALFGFGLAGFGAYSRRRNKKNSSIS